MSEALLGVDVGFSARGKTTGLAWRVDGQVCAKATRSSWESRQAVLPGGVLFDVAALDAPLLPPGREAARRGCENTFYRGAFWNRCRPGLSHHGRGRDLRHAGADAAEQFAAVVRPGALIVEAFPNTFLGVLLHEDTFKRWSPVRKEPKSDWLYREAADQDVFHRLLEKLGWSDDGLSDTLLGEVNHDIRAALVCLLTAGFTSQGTAKVVGDSVGGWFWLPPMDLWEPWAVEALTTNERILAQRASA